MTPADYVLTLSCQDKQGIVAAVSNSIAAQRGNIVESAQFYDVSNDMFFMRVRFTPPTDYQITYFSEAFSPIAAAYNFDWQLHDLAIKPRVLICVSKWGHCLNDLLYRHSIDQFPMTLVGVMSNHETWRKRVEAENLPFTYLPNEGRSKAEQEADLMSLIKDQQVDLVILARYMQILSDNFSNQLFGKIINIHHSFLPSFKGARPYEQAHARGVKLIGATAHYVTPDLDEGPIIEQDTQRVDHAMSPKQFITMGRDIENQVLAKAMQYHLEHRILLNGAKTVIFK